MAKSEFESDLQLYLKQINVVDLLTALQEKEYGWRATGCPPAPQMTPGCLQYQQIDSLIAELR